MPTRSATCSRDQKLPVKMYDCYCGNTKKAPKLKITLGEVFQAEAAPAREA